MKGQIILLTPKPMVVSLLHTTCAHVVNSTGPLRSYEGWDKRKVVHCKIFCILFSFLLLHCDMTDPPINKWNLSLLPLHLGQPCHMVCPVSYWQILCQQRSCPSLAALGNSKTTMWKSWGYSTRWWETSDPVLPVVSSHWISTARCVGVTPSWIIPPSVDLSDNHRQVIMVSWYQLSWLGPEESSSQPKELWISDSFSSPSLRAVCYRAKANIMRLYGKNKNWSYYNHVLISSGSLLKYKY